MTIKPEYISDEFNFVASYDDPTMEEFQLAKASEIPAILDQFPADNRWHLPVFLTELRQHLEGAYTPEEWRALDLIEVKGSTMMGVSLIRAANEDGGDTYMPVIYDALTRRAVIVAPPGVGKDNRDLTYVSSDDPDAADKVNAFLAKTVQLRGPRRPPVQEVIECFAFALASMADFNAASNVAGAQNSYTLKAGATVGNLAVAVAKGEADGVIWSAAVKRKPAAAPAGLP
jgi:hypothetical protein